MKEKILTFTCERLKEASTWQGIGFIVGLFTGRYNDLDWGQAAAVGGVISAAIKTFFPDSMKK